MKKKICYLLGFIFCISLFSAANQTNKQCSANVIGKITGNEICSRNIKQDKLREIGLDLAPLNFFLINF